MAVSFSSAGDLGIEAFAYRFADLTAKRLPAFRFPLSAALTDG